MIEPAEWDRGVDERPSVGRALDAEAAVEHRERVADADEAASVGPGAAHAVVADLEAECAVLDVRDDGGCAARSMPGDVGERLRHHEEQILAEGATKVDRGHLLPGDLVFFRDATGYVHHVGMSLGGDRFIHAPHTGDVVKVSSLEEPYYAEQFTGGRRFDPAVAERDDSPADEHAVAKARAALLRDAAEFERPGTALFLAIEAQESYKNGHTQVLSVITPDQVRRG